MLLRAGEAPGSSRLWGTDRSPTRSYACVCLQQSLHPQPQGRKHPGAARRSAQTLQTGRSKGQSIRAASMSGRVRSPRWLPAAQTAAKANPVFPCSPLSLMSSGCDSTEPESRRRPGLNAGAVPRVSGEDVPAPGDRSRQRALPSAALPTCTPAAERCHPARDDVERGTSSSLQRQEPTY